MCTATIRDENNETKKETSIRSVIGGNVGGNNSGSSGDVVSANGGSKASAVIVSTSVATYTMIVAACSCWISTKSASTSEDTPSHEQYMRTGFFTLLIGYLTIGTAYSSDTTIITYPSPAIWRFQRSLATFYLLMVLVLITLPRDVGRELLRIVFPYVGHQTDFDARIAMMQSSGGSTMGTGTCSFSLQSLYLQIFHAPWFASHAVGWMAKMLVIRDFKTCFLAATLFEVVEVTLVEVVPEFEECWWDSVFLDALGANLIGMAAGGMLNRFLDRKRQRRSLSGKSAQNDDEGDADGASDVEFELGRPFDWAKTKTGPPSSTPIVGRNLPRFAIVTFVLLFAQLLDTITFLLINAYGVVNNKSWAVQGRLHSVGWLCLPAAAEFYSSVEGIGVDKSHKEGSAKQKRNSGSCIMLLLAIALCELWLTCILYFPDHMRREMEREGNVAGLPRNTWIAHAISLIFLAIWTAARYCSPLSRPIIVGGDTNKEDEKERRRRRTVAVVVTDVLLLGAAAVPQCFLFQKGWKWD